MREWLIADLSVSDVHFQLWMLLVTGIVVLWFAYVGQLGSDLAGVGVNSVKARLVAAATISCRGIRVAISARSP